MWLYSCSNRLRRCFWRVVCCGRSVLRVVKKGSTVFFLCFERTIRTQTVCIEGWDRWSRHTTTAQFTTDKNLIVGSSAQKFENTTKTRDSLLFRVSTTLGTQMSRKTRTVHALPFIFVVAVCCSKDERFSELGKKRIAFSFFFSCSSIERDLDPVQRSTVHKEEVARGTGREG
jgi:hypothetical protein